MRNFKLSVLCASVLMVTNATYAQSTNFAGGRIGINENITGSSANISTPSFALNIGENSGGASLEAAYGMPMGKTALLSLGATYSLMTQNAGSVVGGNISETLQQKNLWTAYIEPGTTITDTTLLYAKLAYSNVQGVLNGQYNGSKNFDGVGYGLGIRQMMSKNAYVQVEAMYISYNSQTINSVYYKPTATLGTLGVGYKF